MKISKKLGFLICLLFTLVLLPGVSLAGEIDILVQKLVEKGVLTPGEGQQVLTETKEEVRAQLAAGELNTVPEWVQNTKLKGDLRIRYQWDKKKSSSNQQERMRTRFRYGFESKVNKKTSVVFRIATGSQNDIRSTNQTWTDLGSVQGWGSYYLWLDQAYAQYNLTPWLMLTGGKMAAKKSFWQTGDLMWDGDINVDGFNAKMSRKLGNGVTFNTLAGWYIVNNVDRNADITMAHLQPYIEWKHNEKKNKLKLGGSYYQWNSLGGYDVDSDGIATTSSADTNTTEADGSLKYDYNVWSLHAEYGMKEPLSALSFIPYLAFFGDYVNNPDPDEDNKGYLVGFKFGDAKVKKNGQWQVKYNYRELDKDAWLDFLPDSDAYGGDTGIKANEVAFTYGLGDGLTFGLDYYDSDVNTGTKNKEKVLQADLLWKF